MQFLFLVQGEGRGHLTQALSFAALLRSEGHSLTGVVVGKSQRRSLPDFFVRKIGAEVSSVASPNFETDGLEKQILLGKSIFANLLKVPLFWKSLLQIHRIIEEKKPEVVVNFYEPLGGLYALIFRPHSTLWAIGHQYLEAHPDFVFAPKRPLEKFLFRMHTRLTAIGATERLALSFLPTADKNGVRVVPPLLRLEVKELTVSEGNFFLAYLVNPGYSTEILTYAEKHPEVQIKAFWDKKDAAAIEYPLPNVSFHQVNDQGFLEAMAACKGLICTAGFESVCEAMYLGKPVVMVPTAGQYEQACNALDGEASGAGKKADFFDFSLLISLANAQPSRTIYNREWAECWPSEFKKLVKKTGVEMGKKKACVGSC